ncbi:hypothetical protein F5Y14DRAFT_110598 [Nemania sp. NC0429]|nr:hypothetical protein F5Y14DRAFT_110598 [Nemania sp. NC0429]
MHFISFAMAIGAILAVSAIPINETTTDSTSTMELTNATSTMMEEDMLSVSSSRKRKKIPVSEVECFDQQLSPSETEEAKEDLVQWTSRNKGVPPRSQRKGVSTSRISTDAVVWIVCNLKTIQRKHISLRELNEVEGILNEKCAGGQNQAGMVYSKKWRKEYIVATRQWYQDRIAGRDDNGRDDNEHDDNFYACKHHLERRTRKGGRADFCVTA